MDYWRSNSSSHSWGIRPKPITFVVHFLGIVSVIFVFIWAIYFRGGLNFNAANSNHIFNVHPVLMLLSFVFLASEAILAYKTLPGSKAFRKLVHLSLHLAALVLAIVGICAAFKYHNLNSIDNLYSLHSWLGLVTIILFGIQWLIGFVTFFFSRLTTTCKGFGAALARFLWTFHIWVGYCNNGVGIFGEAHLPSTEQYHWKV